MSPFELLKEREYAAVALLFFSHDCQSFNTDYLEGILAGLMRAAGHDIEKRVHSNLGKVSLVSRSCTLHVNGEGPELRLGLAVHEGETVDAEAVLCRVLRFAGYALKPEFVRLPGTSDPLGFAEWKASFEPVRPRRIKPLNLVSRRRRPSLLETGVIATRMADIAQTPPPQARLVR